MKKIRCVEDSRDYIKVSTNDEVATVTIGVCDQNCDFDTDGLGVDLGIYLSPEKIRKLRKQLKKALREIEGEGEVEEPEDFPEWFQEGKKVVITENSNVHEFDMGEVVIVGSSLGDNGTSKRCYYLDGHDYWYVLPSDCKPYKEDEA